MTWVTRVTCRQCGRLFPTTDRTAEPDVCWMCESAAEKKAKK